MLSSARSGALTPSARGEDLWTGSPKNSIGTQVDSCRRFGSQAKGYVQIEGETYPLIYPTVEALRQQDRRLTESKAREIVKKLKG